MFYSRFRRLACGSLLAACALASSASASINVWSNATGNGNVNDPGNWSLGHIPTTTDSVIIAAGSQIVMNGGIITADTITCYISLYVNGGTIRCHELTTTSNFSTYNNAIIDCDHMEIAGTWSMFATLVRKHENETDPKIHIQPTATMTMGDGLKTITIGVDNEGVVEGYGQLLYLGSGYFPVFFNNLAGGVIRNVNFTQLTPTPPFYSSYVINESIMQYQGGTSNLDVYFANAGLLELDAANVNLTHLALSPGQLDSGGWTLKNGSTLTHNLGDLSRMGPFVTVRLENGANYFGGLSRVTQIEGRFELKNTTFQLAPPFFGNVQLAEYGFLRMEQGARIEVLGGFSIANGAVLDKLVTQPNANDVIACYASSAVGGDLIVELQDESLVPNGTTIPLMTDINDCCNVGGAFQSVLVFGTPLATEVDYQPHVARLVIGEPISCPGDLDGDSAVGITDLAILLSNYGVTGSATVEDGDFDGDYDVDINDLSQMLSRFGTTCE